MKGRGEKNKTVILNSENLEDILLFANFYSMGIEEKKNLKCFNNLLTKKMKQILSTLIIWNIFYIYRGREREKNLIRKKEMQKNANERNAN